MNASSFYLIQKDQFLNTQSGLSTLHLSMEIVNSNFVGQVFELNFMKQSKGDH